MGIILIINISVYTFAAWPIEKDMFSIKAILLKKYLELLEIVTFTNEILTCQNLAGVWPHASIQTFIFLGLGLSPSNVQGHQNK
jgi:hypothetical protein